ncbi:MAG TPA: kelch repeat-containing protein, partial [Tepidisphaeraceae bacterium]|nr:kelch repeat-containing protein [Tepidisphaeraceae bacterium]
MNHPLRIAGVLWLIVAGASSAAGANDWRVVAEDGAGPRVGPAVVWSAERGRFVMVGGTISHEKKPPFVYDVVSLDEKGGQWENELPTGGESWGPAVGVVTPPGFKTPYFSMKDEGGNVRLWQRHARLAYNGRVAPWDGKFYALVCGRTLAYDVSKREWRDLKPATGPVPETKSEREGLNWHSICADPLNKEMVLFGGAGVLSARGDAGTWMYSTEANTWRQLELKVQPPPRALGPMVYDPAARKIVLFGGDGLDTLYGDTWVYDCATRVWEERRPKVGPAPRFGHAMLHLPKSGKVVLMGGVGYTSSTAYQANLYKPLPFEIWAYDVAGNEWALVRRYGAGEGPGHSSTDAAVAAVDDQDRVLWWGPKAEGGRTDKGAKAWVCEVDATKADQEGTAKFGVPAGTVVHRTGPYDPAWYSADVPAADEKAQAEWYANVPANKWVAVEAPKWPTNRQGGGWSTVAWDAERRQFLHLGGGHSSYFGNDVAHFDTDTARWSISYRPQFALDFNYDLTGPGPHAFNGGPWGNHNYHAYAYDGVRKRLTYVRGNYTFFYDPAGRRWRADERIDNNPFSGSKYTSYLAATPEGVVCWAFRGDSNGPAGVWRLGKDGWSELKTTGEALPKPVTDGSTITVVGMRLLL